MAVIPLHVNIKMLFYKSISECNQIGNFLEEDYIITNVKEYTFPEIHGFLRGRNKEV
ncbi:MAG: hypothetical protein HC896_07885 [Bacteroidales bacterium]|nr:hypothetical protein [Bacteroidales bacterium]